MSGGFWNWLDKRAERRDARRLLLIDRGLDWRSLICQTAKGFDARLLIAFAIIGMFGWAFAANMSDDTMKGALIAAFAGAWGYYLGSSRSASAASDRADNAVELAKQTVLALPPPAVDPAADIRLQPGERATVAAEEEEAGGEGDPPARPAA